MFRLNGLHSSGVGSGKSELPEVPEEEDADGMFENGDSTQMPARQQPSESQSICPGMPVESPQMRPSSQQLFGGICPAGLVQRHASPAAGRGCVWLAERVEPPPPSPSTVCEHATRQAMANEAVSVGRRGFMSRVA